MSTKKVLKSVRPLTTGELVRAVEEIRAWQPTCRLGLPEQVSLRFQPSKLPALDESPASLSMRFHLEVSVPAGQVTTPLLVELLDRFRVKPGHQGSVRISVHVHSPRTSHVTNNMAGEVYLTLGGRGAAFDIRVGNDPQHYFKPQEEFARLQTAHRALYSQRLQAATNLPSLSYQIAGEPTERSVERLLAAVEVFSDMGRPTYSAWIDSGMAMPQPPTYQAAQSLADPWKIRSCYFSLAGPILIETIRRLLQYSRSSYQTSLGSVHLRKDSQKGLGTVAAYLATTTRFTGHEVTLKVIGESDRLARLFPLLGITAQGGSAESVEPLNCIAEHPIVLDPAWLTPDVQSLTRAAFEHLLPADQGGDLDPQRLLILADALEEAGASPELVQHLRWSGQHVLGCFAVELLRSFAKQGTRRRRPQD